MLLKFSRYFFATLYFAFFNGIVATMTFAMSFGTYSTILERSLNFVSSGYFLIIVVGYIFPLFLASSWITFQLAILARKFLKPIRFEIESTLFGALAPVISSIVVISVSRPPFVFLVVAVVAIVAATVFGRKVYVRTWRKLATILALPSTVAEFKIIE